MSLLFSITMTAGICLRVSVCTLLFVAIYGYPQKGSQSTGQASFGGGGHVAHHGGATRLPAAPYSAVRDAHGAHSGHTLMHGSSPYHHGFVAPGVGSGSSTAAGMPGAGMSPVVHMGQGGSMVSGVPGGAYSAGVSGVPGSAYAAGVPGANLVSSMPGAYVVGPQVYEPVADYDAGTQSGEPETRWTVPTTVFSEPGSADTQYLSDVLPPAPSAPQGPTLRSGETSSVVKEAELGNYQQQTEEFGYPADYSGSGVQYGQGLAPVLFPGVQLGGLRPAPSVRFDRMLLYGLYPPGSYSTFSQNHEAGKDYSQDIHYLKEHVHSGHGGQQKKFFPGV